MMGRFDLRRVALMMTMIAGLVMPADGYAQAASATPSLAFPVDCVLGETCFIQFHLDLAPGLEIRDYACGRLTYDGHNGTDIRLPDYPSMRAGVAVLAAADGVVRAVRDGEPDLSLDDRAPGSLKGKDAGNGVVVVHGDGWETQYSHLMLGSVAVKAGDQVKQGQMLGKIGLSGRTSFPHLHFSVRLNQTDIDPFLGAEPYATCEHPGTPLWDKTALAMMPYRPGGVLLAGFASAEPNKAAVRGGADRGLAFDAGAPALLFYVDIFGVLAGDIESLVITAPDGSVFAQHKAVLDKDMQQRLQYVGKKRPRDGWRLGVYRGEYRLTRNVAGKTQVIASMIREATISER